MFGTNISVFDSALYSPLFTQKEMKKIWVDDNLLQSWIDFEVAISKVQSELGVIPINAAISIKKVCDSFHVDWPRMAVDTEKVGMAIKPLIDQISEQGDDYVKQYLHWGCTTQDLLDTSLAIRLKQTLIMVRQQLVELGTELKIMSMQHKDTVCVGRTNSMDALPTTWGLQVSSYLQEITRHISRLDTIYPRAITGMYGGAIGNLSSSGEQGLEIRRRLFEELELTEPQGLNNGSLDSIAELVQYFALIHGSLCRIANDVELMGRAPIAEVCEGEIGGGSSTMPHKSNPRASNMIQTLSRMGWMYASSAPNLMDQQDLRAASMRVLNWTLVPEASLAVSTSLERAHRLIKNLIVNKENMRSNFSASRNFIMSESVMMVAAKKIGRSHSYQIVQTALSEADDTSMLDEILKANTQVREILTESEIDLACDPINYLGSNDALINESVINFDRVLNHE